ncbi:MerR family DNA-binding transcriptional regulator [Rhodococcus opacus]|nr:MerR family DNA-binding transcriptional regulator [Rhodococcus opacus]RZL84283.1 MAG: MerR family DNA-binding transcriptional regulator [Rhodococcus sp. (in: high G+C Gram-positive bacteria)]
MNVQTLRYYEHRGLLEEPPRSSAGHRFACWVCLLLRHLSISTYVEARGIGERCLLLTPGTRTPDRGLGRGSGPDVQGTR